MPPERKDPASPSEWMRRARSNLARAKAHCNLSEVLYEDLCFDAQQAAEKSIKAVFLHGKLKLPRTHDILNMLGLLQRSC